MASKKLIIPLLSITLLLPCTITAETASDYVHRGAQKYIFGQDAAAEAEVNTGLAKFPNDPELNDMAGLFHKKKPPQSNDSQSQKQQQSQQSQQNQQDQQQQQSQSQNQNNTAQNSQQQKQQQQSQSQNQQKNDQRQSQSLAKNESQKNQQPRPNESPSSSGDQNQKQDQPTPGEQPPDQPPTPSDGQEQSPSPSPGEGSQENPEPTATPTGTPRKPAGELKAAGADDQSQKPPQNARQLADAENTNPGQMTPQQAEALLRSMKDEEARVQLDERRQRRTVYKDW